MYSLKRLINFYFNLYNRIEFNLSFITISFPFSKCFLANQIEAAEADVRKEIVQILKYTPDEVDDDGRGNDV